MENETATRKTLRNNLKYDIYIIVHKYVYSSK